MDDPVTIHPCFNRLKVQPGGTSVACIIRVHSMILALVGNRVDVDPTLRSMRLKLFSCRSFTWWTPGMQPVWNTRRSASRFRSSWVSDSSEPPWTVQPPVLDRAGSGCAGVGFDLSGCLNQFLQCRRASTKQRCQGASVCCRLLQIQSPRIPSMSGI